MKVLVINAGSSSLKYQLIDMDGEKVLAKGNCEKIGLDGLITHKTHKGHVDSHECSFPTHAEAFQELLRLLVSGDEAVIADPSEISAVGHRVVQGGEKYSSSVMVTPEILSDLEELGALAPLHNPAHVMAIRACQAVLPKSVPQVVVFDTSFHQTIPPKAYMFPIPYEMYKKHHIRRYGFHGTSHRFVSARLAKFMGKPLQDLKIVTCHLGNGSSITAVDGGKSVDTTMGFTPLDGLIMGTRCGSIDPSVVTFLMEKENLNYQQMNDLLNKKSGYLGVSGVTSDQRDLVVAAEAGNSRAQLALDIQRYGIKKYIGAYAAAMGGIDAVVFTGGIGENSATTREVACEGLEFMGIHMDKERNRIVPNGIDAEISAPGSTVKVFVIPTNEELLIAQDTAALVSAL
ncbi:acetate kinase [Oscillospiraceae bacterium MB08-C2-2]|nr:acetate kinase [Oscillospiraceae bacterium MB08-C2-2]